jgi:transcriptional regulator with XRE-family HTH domain
MLTIGEYLSRGRKQKRLSLREVEAATGISNAYLSQLENNRIQEPSPTILDKLSSTYGIPYIECLRLAGYPVPKGITTSRIAARLGETTKEEEDALAEYLQFLRLQRSAKRR